MDFTKEMHGMKISCVIQSINVPEGVIYEEDGTFFILQNFRQGSFPNGKHSFNEFKSSWSVASGKQKDIIQNGVKDIKFLNQKYELWT